MVGRVARAPVRRALVAALLATVLAACNGGNERTAARTTKSTTTTTSSTTTTTTTLPPGPPPYAYAVGNVTAADLGASWHEGCPVNPANLRRISVSIVGFDGVAQNGQLVVNADVVDDVVEVFRQLYVARFPIRKMKPIFTQAEFEDFETPDDNSSGFSCRNAVDANAAPHWSNHAYGH
jgi:uncharacterized lipoprotein